MHFLFELIVGAIGGIIGWFWADGESRRRWLRAAVRGRYLLGEVDTRSLVIRTPKAEFDWRIPAMIAPRALRALRGAAPVGEPATAQDL